MLSSSLSIQADSIFLFPFFFNSDAFAGGFCAGVVSGKSLDESIDMGQWLASKGIQELGPS